MAISEDEIEISFFRSGGPGGQHRNVTETAVRVRHIPTGIVVVSSASRSQHRNRELALEELERRLARRNRPRKKRVRTRPSAASRAQRLKEKRQRSETKKLRRPPRGEE